MSVGNLTSKERPQFVPAVRKPKLPYLCAGAECVTCKRPVSGDWGLVPDECETCDAERQARYYRSVAQWAEEEVSRLKAMLAARTPPEATDGPILIGVDFAKPGSDFTVSPCPSCHGQGIEAHECDDGKLIEGPDCQKCGGSGQVRRPHEPLPTLTNSDRVVDELLECHSDAGSLDGYDVEQLLVRHGFLKMVDIGPDDERCQECPGDCSECYRWTDDAIRIGRLSQTKGDSL